MRSLDLVMSQRLLHAKRLAPNRFDTTIMCHGYYYVVFFMCATVPLYSDLFCCMTTVRQLSRLHFGGGRVGLLRNCSCLFVIVWCAAPHLDKIVWHCLLSSR